MLDYIHKLERILPYMEFRETLCYSSSKVLSLKGMSEAINLHVQCASWTVSHAYLALQLEALPVGTILSVSL